MFDNILYAVCFSYDENLMGDSADRARLAGMSEKEREQEIFKRIEQRELKRTRYFLNFYLFYDLQIVLFQKICA